MEIETLDAIARTAAIGAGILFGSTSISSACWVWIRKQLYGVGGSSLSLVGVILIGFSIWHSVEFGVGPSGINFKASAELQRILDESSKTLDGPGSKMALGRSPISLGSHGWLPLDLDQSVLVTWTPIPEFLLEEEQRKIRAATAPYGTGITSSAYTSWRF